MVELEIKRKKKSKKVEFGIINTKEKFNYCHLQFECNYKRRIYTFKKSDTYLIRNKKTSHDSNVLLLKQPNGKGNESSLRSIKHSLIASIILLLFKFFSL